MKRPGAHFHVVGLQEGAALPGPKILQRQDQALERTGGVETRVLPGGVLYLCAHQSLFRTGNQDLAGPRANIHPCNRAKSTHGQAAQHNRILMGGE